METITTTNSQTTENHESTERSTLDSESTPRHTDATTPDTTTTLNPESTSIENLETTLNIQSTTENFDSTTNVLTTIDQTGATDANLQSTTENNVHTTTLQTTTIIDESTTAKTMCPPGTFGNVPHPYQCDAFFMCMGGVAVPLFCRTGEEFDPVTRVSRLTIVACKGGRILCGSIPEAPLHTYFGPMTAVL